MRDADARVMASDCPLAALQIQQATGIRPLHSLEVFARLRRCRVPGPGAADSEAFSMKPITANEILALADYERVRGRLRPLCIHERDHRRLAVGSHLTLLFENGQTVWHQIQEMIRTEKLATADAIAHEIETYNELLPRPGELAATMLIEYPEPVQRDATLRRLLGLENHLWISMDEKRERALFDTPQMTTDRIGSVQFVRFPVGSVDRGGLLALAEAGKLAIEVDHPSLGARAAIVGNLARALAEDLPG
jgi:hypothetical protein